MLSYDHNSLSDLQVIQWKYDGLLPPGIQRKNQWMSPHESPLGLDPRGTATNAPPQNNPPPPLDYHTRMIVTIPYCIIISLTSHSSPSPRRPDSSPFQHPFAAETSAASFPATVDTSLST